MNAIVGYYGIVAVKATVPHIYDILFCLKVVVQSGWHLYIIDVSAARWPGLVVCDSMPAAVWMRVCAVRLRGVQPRRWLHVPGAAARGTELCDWYGSGGAVRHGSVVRCRAEFWRQSRYSLLGVSERRVFLEVSRTVTPFDCSAVQTGLLLFWFLPFCLFCHWRVGRVGRRGLLT
jgi:hypothetical protein